MIFFINYTLLSVFSFLRYGYILVIIILAILGGINSNIEDFKEYQNIFESVPDLFNFFGEKESSKLYGELGYLLWNSLIKTVFDNYYFFRIITLFLSFSIVLIIFKRTSTFLPISIIYFLMYFYYTDTIILRTTLSASFILLSLYNIVNKKYVLSILFLFIAFFFHVSSLAVIIILLFYWLFPVNKKTIVLILAITFVISNIGLVNMLATFLNSFFPDSYVSLKLNDNLNGSLLYVSRIFRGTVILHMLIITYLTCNLEKYLVFKYFKLFFLTYIFSFVFMVSFNDLGLFGDRLFFIFSLTFPVLLSYIINVNATPKSLLIVGIIIFITILFLQKMIYFDEYIIKFF